VCLPLVLSTGQETIGYAAVNFSGTSTRGVCTYSVGGKVRVRSVPEMSLTKVEERWEGNRA